MQLALIVMLGVYPVFHFARRAWTRVLSLVALLAFAAIFGWLGWPRIPIQAAQGQQTNQGNGNTSQRGSGNSSQGNGGTNQQGSGNTTVRGNSNVVINGNGNTVAGTTVLKSAESEKTEPAKDGEADKTSEIQTRPLIEIADPVDFEQDGDGLYFKLEIWNSGHSPAIGVYIQPAFLLLPSKNDTKEVFKANPICERNTKFRSDNGQPMDDTTVIFPSGKPAPGIFGVAHLDPPNIPPGPVSFRNLAGCIAYRERPDGPTYYTRVIYNISEFTSGLQPFVPPSNQRVIVVRRALYDLQEVATHLQSNVWTDPATGFTWTAYSNKTNVSWKEAENYCKNFGIDGSAWRLPTIEELSSLYVRTPESWCGALQDGVEVPTCHINTNVRLLFGSRAWSITLDSARRGQAWFFDFGASRRMTAPLHDDNFRALCVSR